MLGMLLGIGQSASAETWAERLGYPSEKRVLILHAVQMGMCFETNQAGEEALVNGVVQSAGVMAPCPWFGEFADWHRNHPEIDVGLSLTFNSEWKHYRWGTVLPRTEVSGLVDADGYLWRSVLQFSMNAHAEEVQREIDAQIQRARAAGLQPGHFSIHLGALISRPDLASVYLSTARKHWIPAVIVELTPELLKRFREQGFPLSEDMVELIARYPLPKLDNFQFIPPADTYEEKRGNFFQLIQELPPGITQINLEPAVESDGLKRITDDWQQRVWDAQLLADPEVRAFLDAEGVILTNWKEMMRRFEGEPPSEYAVEAQP